MIDVVGLGRGSLRDNVIVFVDYIPFYLDLGLIKQAPNGGMSYTELDISKANNPSSFDYGHFNSRFSNESLAVMKNTVKEPLTKQLQGMLKQGLTYQEVNNILKQLYLKKLVQLRILS